MVPVSVASTAVIEAITRLLTRASIMKGLVKALPNHCVEQHTKSDA